MYLKLGLVAHMYHKVSQTDMTIVHHVMSEKKMFFQLFRFFRFFRFFRLGNGREIENQGYNASYLRNGV